jgi:hypothetical protein
MSMAFSGRRWNGEKSKESVGMPPPQVDVVSGKDNKGSNIPRLHGFSPRTSRCTWSRTWSRTIRTSCRTSPHPSHLLSHLLYTVTPPVAPALVPLAPAVAPPPHLGYPSHLVTHLVYTVAPGFAPPLNPFAPGLYVAPPVAPPVAPGLSVAPGFAPGFPLFPLYTSITVNDGPRHVTYYFQEHATLPRQHSRENH